jgi:hypothetical protein
LIFWIPITSVALCVHLWTTTDLLFSDVHAWE